jgi:3-hexulose-6-phosphate synthase
MKKFQVALDLFSIEDTLNVLEKVGEFVDIIELGTPLMIKEGVSAVKVVKGKFPDKIVFADIKVMDGGSVIPKIAFNAGADMVSVLAVAEDNTIKATIDCANEYKKDVLVDMCSVPDIGKRAKEVDLMGPKYICVHVGYDIQNTGADPIEELKNIVDVKSHKAIAGGIKLSNFEEAVKSPADLIIVGGGLYNQPNMREIAQKMHAIIKG